MSGRHGVPSLLRWTLPVVTAQPTRLLTTISPRSRGDTPYTVALRRNVGLNLSSASSSRSCSTATLDSAYAVIGEKDACSSRMSSGLDAPYTLHDDENRNRPTPACFAARASRIEAW